RLRAGRAADADRPRGEERDPDRRVRQGGAREGRGDRRRRAQGCATPTAPDPHDVVRVHPRPVPALERPRRRSAGAPGDRHGHHRRHDVRDRRRDLPGPGALRGRRTPDSPRTTRRGGGEPGPASRGARAAARDAMTRIHGLVLTAVVLGTVWRLEVGPQYKRPAVDTPEDFRGRLGPADAASFADLPWWQVFEDPTLQGLVGGALEGNYDLQAAVARIDQARAQIGVAASQFFPQIGYAGTAARGRIPGGVISATIPAATFDVF